MREGGWLVLVEIEAGRGELSPVVLAVALDDHREALAAAREAPAVLRATARPRLGGKPWPIHKVELVSPVDAATISKLGLGRGELWNVYDPPLTNRI